MHKMAIMADKECFDLLKVTNILEMSLQATDEDDVLLAEYLLAYVEINKFFNALGTVFSFVSNDVVAKIALLNDYLRDDALEGKFKTIKTMIAHELTENLLTNKKYVSGSRTLLRLHRGLEFIYEFLLRVQELKETDKTNAVCKTAYNETLAKHHPFLIRKAALLAMMALPTQKELLERTCSDVRNALDLLPTMLEHTKLVYDRTQRLYVANNLLELS